MSVDLGYRTMGRVTLAIFLTIFCLAAVGTLSCAAFMVWVGVKLLGLLP